MNSNPCRLFLLISINTCIYGLLRRDRVIESCLKKPMTIVYTKAIALFTLRLRRKPGAMLENKHSTLITPFTMYIIALEQS